MNSNDDKWAGFSKKGSIVLILVVLASFQYRLWIADGSLAENQALQTRVDRSVADNINKHNRNRLLLAEIRELRSGLESIEERARSELGMIKEGETFFLLVDDRVDP